MKLKYFTLAMAFAMALALTGCSANRDVNSDAPMSPTNTVSSDQNDRPGSDVGGGSQDGSIVGDDQNGTVNNDGTGRSITGSGMQGRSDVGNAIDDIGNAAGNLARGAGNAVQDAGNAIGNAANSVGRAVS